MIKSHVSGMEYEVGIEGVKLEALAMPSYALSEASAQTVHPVSVPSAPVSASSALVEVLSPPTPVAAGESVVTTPMPGKILRVLVGKM